MTYLWPERVRGLDGKSYPSRPMHGDDLEWLRGRAHYLFHDEGLSVREIVARIGEENSIRRSAGTVHAWLTRWRCEDCSGAAEWTPEQPSQVEETAA